MIAGLAAQKFGKPVRLTLTTSEDMLFAGAKHEVVVNYRVTFDTNGKIITATFKAFANSGCSLDNSIVWTQASFDSNSILAFLISNQFYLYSANNIS